MYMYTCTCTYTYTYMYMYMLYVYVHCITEFVLNTFEFIIISRWYIYMIWYDMIGAFVNVAFVQKFNCASLFALRLLERSFSALGACTPLKVRSRHFTTRHRAISQS